VRLFLSEEIAAGRIRPRVDAWTQGFSREFSRKLGARGWIGMAIPTRYGGAGRTPLERLVVAEECLAAGAPVSAHWIAERQFAPMLLQVGTEAQRERFLPKIVAGELVSAIGMSEPDSGSDLASVASRAEPAKGGWVLNGRKVWTSNAHRADVIVALCRTSSDAPRDGGLSQLIIDTSSPGVEIRTIATMNETADFCEVYLDDVFVPDDMVLGTVGDGWRQVTSELAYERSGPERLLSTFPLLELAAAHATAPSDVETIGTIVAHVMALRALSWGTALAIAEGEDVSLRAAATKDAGTEMEQTIVDEVRRLHPDDSPEPDALDHMLRQALLSRPLFTIRGGTTEILRRIVSRDLLR
jgi:alkylation response protein AidB-like acyl-CoA dehydrogenase